MGCRRARRRPARGPGRRGRGCAPLGRRRSALPRRLVVGQHTTRRDRSKRPSRARRHGRALGARRDRAGSPNAVPAARPGSRAPLRVVAPGRAGLARAAAGSLAAPGRRARGDHDGSPAEAAEERVRRTHLARAPRRACRPARGPLEADRPPRRARGRLRPAACVARGVDRARPSRRTARRGRRRRPRRRAGALRGTPRPLPRLGPLPPASGFGPERGARRRGRDRARVAARLAALARPGRRALLDRRLRARRRSSAVGRQGGDRRSARLGGVAPRETGRPLVLPPARRVRAARLEPVRPARRRLPALVRGRRVDLPARAALRAGPRGLSAPREAGCRSRGLDRVRPRDRAGALVPVPRGSAADGAGERARRPCGPAAARARVRRGAGGSLLPTRREQRLRGSTAGARRISRRARGSSAAFRVRRCARAAALLVVLAVGAACSAYAWRRWHQSSPRPI